MLDAIIKPSLNLFGFLTEEEAMVELGLTEAAADGSDGTVVCGAVIKPPQFE